MTNRAPSDLDPHSAYDAGSGVLLQGPFEGLIRAKANTTDVFVPVLAVTTIDLALSWVIFLLLIGMALRAVMHFYRHSDLPAPPWAGSAEGK